MVSVPAIRFGFVVGALAAVLGGCASENSGEGQDLPSLSQIAEEALESGHDWQADVLDDGDITLAEYDEGHRRTLACLDDVGISYSEPVRSVVNGYTWDYRMSWPNMDDSAGADLSYQCYEQNLQDLELAMSAWGEWEMDAALFNHLVDCISKRGFEVDPSARNHRDVLNSGAATGITRPLVETCVQTGMLQLYPDHSYTF